MSVMRTYTPRSS